MTEEKGPATPGTAHEERVQSAFDALHEAVGDRLDEESREAVERLRQATSERDVDEARAQLAGVRQRHGWLYTELAKHPDIATLIDELALWGF